MEMLKKCLLWVPRFLIQEFTEIERRPNKLIFVWYLEVLKVLSGMWIRNRMKQLSNKTSSFHNCSYSYWESRHTKPSLYVFLKSTSVVQSDQERREKQARELLDEKINLCLASDHRKSGLYYWDSGSNAYFRHHPQIQLPQIHYFIR